MFLGSFSEPSHSQSLTLQLQLGFQLFSNWVDTKSMPHSPVFRKGGKSELDIDTEGGGNGTRGAYHLQSLMLCLQCLLLVRESCESMTAFSGNVPAFLYCSVWSRPGFSATVALQAKRIIKHTHLQKGWPGGQGLRFRGLLPPNS